MSAGPVAVRAASDLFAGLDCSTVMVRRRRDRGIARRLRCRGGFVPHGLHRIEITALPSGTASTAWRDGRWIFAPIGRGSIVMAPYALGAGLMIASGSIHAVGNAIVNGGRDKAAGRGITDAAGAIVLLPALLVVPWPVGAWGCSRRARCSMRCTSTRWCGPMRSATCRRSILCSAAPLRPSPPPVTAAVSIGWSLLTGVLIASYTVIDAQQVRAAPSPATYIVWVFVEIGAVVIVLFGAATRGGIFRSVRVQWKPGWSPGCCEC